MLIDTKNSGRRINPYGQITLSDGTRYANLYDARDKWEANGIKEIPDPARGNDETHYTTEQDFPPYVVITPKPQEILDAQHNAKVVAQITAIEAGQARAVREAALGSTTHLEAIEAKVAALRATLKPLP